MNSNEGNDLPVEKVEIDPNTWEKDEKVSLIQFCLDNIDYPSWMSKEDFSRSIHAIIFSGKNPRNFRLPMLAGNRLLFKVPIRGYQGNLIRNRKYDIQFTENGCIILGKPEEKEVATEVAEAANGVVVKAGNLVSKKPYGFWLSFAGGRLGGILRKMHDNSSDEHFKKFISTICDGSKKPEYLGKIESFIDRMIRKINASLGHSFVSDDLMRIELDDKSFCVLVFKEDGTEKKFSIPLGDMITEVQSDTPDWLEGDDYDKNFVKSLFFPNGTIDSLDVFQNFANKVRIHIQKPTIQESIVEYIFSLLGKDRYIGHVKNIRIIGNQLIFTMAEGGEVEKEELYTGDEMRDMYGAGEDLSQYPQRDGKYVVTSSYEDSSIGDTYEESFTIDFM